jgi:SAM-dependent methyltransferase
MPFADGSFDFCVSHGVLDSMPFTIARDAMKETARCLKPGALFYLDLVAGDDREHYPEFSGEEVVQEAHENGTIQSYFNWGKILELAGSEWVVKEAFLIRKTSVTSPAFHSRYHIVLENRG